MAVASLWVSCPAMAQQDKRLVRLAKIEVDTNRVHEYNEFLKEEIDASILKEPGVITLYGIAEKENPQRVTLFETYADSTQYRSHLATPHFQKYKQGTLEMVKHLELVQMQPILYHRKPGLSSASTESLYIRLINIELDSTAVEHFSQLGNAVVLPGIKKEPGVLVMYVVAEKDCPTQVSILEVYKDIAAYNKHIAAPHYLKYKKASETMVRTLKLIDVNPILLGAKPSE